MAQGKTAESISLLRADLITAKALVWVASVGRDVELTPEAHVYFFDRYRRLAEHHRRRGQPKPNVDPSKTSPGTQGLQTARRDGPQRRVHGCYLFLSCR